MIILMIIVMIPSLDIFPSPFPIFTLPYHTILYLTFLINPPYHHLLSLHSKVADNDNDDKNGRFPMLGIQVVPYNTSCHTPYQHTPDQHNNNTHSINTL